MLLVVVLFLLAVTAVLAPLVLAARTEFVVASNRFRQDQFDLVAEGLMTVLSREFAAPQLEARNPAILIHSEPMRCRAGHLEIDVRVQDQRGLVDLNAASIELLQAGFSALGLSGGEAQNLANAAAAFRRVPGGSEPGGSGDVPFLDTGIVSDGLKQAPFEAIEELYDFKGMRNIPLRTLSEAFTIHSKRETIVGDRLSLRLAKILPATATARYPFIVEEEPFPQVYRIDVFVGSDESQVSGYSGAVILATGDKTGQFQTIERVTNPSFLPTETAAFSNEQSCGSLFGQGVASVLSTVAG